MRLLLLQLGLLLLQCVLLLRTSLKTALRRTTWRYWLMRDSV